MGMVLDEPGENEKTVTVNEIDILIDDYERHLIDGTVIDYVKEANGEGFVINSGSTC